MARGFLKGVFWGGLVSVLVAGALSVLSDGPRIPNADTDVLDSARAPAPGTASDTEAATDADLVLENDPPQVASPVADDVQAAEQAGADVLLPPEVGAPDDLSGPTMSAQSGAVDVETAVPVVPADQGVMPAAPVSESELSISTDPAQPPAPAVPDIETAFAPDEDDQPAVPDLETPLPEVRGESADLETPEIAEEMDTPASAPKPAAQDADVRPELPSASEELPGPALDVAETDTTPQTSETAELRAPQTSDGLETKVEEPEPDNQGEDNAGATGDVVAALPSIDNPDETNDRPTIGRPATSLIDRATEAPVREEPEDTEDTPATDLKPIEAFATPFENSDNKPLMSIILIDTGVDLTGADIGLAALKSFPYPLTFAVDSSLNDATTRMADYRAQGFEVLAMMDLPKGATATDAEVALSAALDAVPEAVGVMEGTGTGVQENRDAADQIAEAANVAGLGLVLQSKGLNTVHKLAVRDGVPAGLIFRDFDSAGQTPTVIRRFLDQAAFRAGQEGSVIMMGRVRSDTISALLLWGLQDRAERVALAPVSAVLNASVAGN